MLRAWISFDNVGIGRNDHLWRPQWTFGNRTFTILLEVITRAIEHVYISKWWQSLPLILRISCGVYFTWSTQLSSVECTLHKIRIIFPITVSHSFTGARFLWTTLRVDLKQNHCDLALFRLVNLVQSFVSAVQSGRHKELGRPGKFQQTLPSDSLKLQTLSQHFWSTCLKRCFYWYDIYLWFLRSFELISQGWLRFNYCNFTSRGLGNVLWQDGAIPTMACEDLRMASHRAIIVMSGRNTVPTLATFHRDSWKWRVIPKMEQYIIPHPVEI